MILGIGVDIIEIKRVIKACEKEAFLARCFTEEELGLFNTRGIEIAASNFAVKEAVSKVFGTGIKGFSLKDIEVLRDSFGQPYVRCHNGAREIQEKLGITRIMVTISHTKENVVAFAIGER